MQKHKPFTFYFLLFTFYFLWLCLNCFSLNTYAAKMGGGITSDTTPNQFIFIDQNRSNGGCVDFTQPRFFV